MILFPLLIRKNLFLRHSNMAMASQHVLGQEDPRMDKWAAGSPCNGNLLERQGILQS